MTDKTIDKIRGRTREAGGALAGDSTVKNRGRAEQAKGSVKKAVDKVQERLTGRPPARGA